MVKSHQHCLAFSTLIREHWADLKSLITTQHFDRDQPIYLLGERAGAIYRIESGQAKVSLVSEQGREKIISIYQAGDFFGEVCLCGMNTRNEQAVALDPLTVVRFDLVDMLRLLKERQDLTLDLLMVFCARLVECQEQVGSLAFDEVPRRLAKELLQLSRLPEGRPENGGVQLSLSLTHEELAKLVHTTRENLTAIMNRFRRLGLLEYGYRKIVVFPYRLSEYLNE